MVELNKFYNMDCMVGMKDIPDKYFDLAIVDPPYGIGEDGSKSKSRGNGYSTFRNAADYVKEYKPFIGNDKKPESKEYFDELIRISKNQIIWGANHFIGNIPNANSSCWVVWDKRNGESDFADCELAWTSFKTAVRKFEFKWNGMLQENMKSKELRIHPTQKPVALYEWLLNNYAKEGDKIIDTHVGSASSLIACYNLGFDYVGFELDKDYFNLACKRIETRKNQMDIFNDFESFDRKDNK